MDEDEDEETPVKKIFPMSFMAFSDHESFFKFKTKIGIKLSIVLSF